MDIYELQKLRKDAECWRALKAELAGMEQGEERLSLVEQTPVLISRPLPSDITRLMMKIVD